MSSKRHKDDLAFQNQPAGGIASGMVSLSKRILHGLSQIMLQENVVTGLLFLIGIFIGSIPMGLAALLATTCGTVTAMLMRYGRSEIDQGLYGFSASLVGVAIMLFFKPALISWLMVIIGSALAAVAQHFFIKRNIPVFTLPFVLVTWWLVWVGTTYFAELSVVPSAVETSAVDHLFFAVRGFGQVIFQSNVFSSLLFFVAVFVSSPTAALYGLTAALFSSLLATVFMLPTAAIGMGLWGYNAVLCAIVFAGPQVKDGIWVLLAVAVAFFIQLAMSPYGLAPLTFPFVAGSCLTILVRRWIASITTTVQSASR